MSCPEGAVVVHRIVAEGVIDEFLKVYLSPIQAKQVAKMLKGTLWNDGGEFVYAIGITEGKETYLLWDNILEISTNHERIDEIIERYWTPGRAAYQRWRRHQKKEEERRIDEKDPFLFDIDILKMKHLKQGRPTSKKRLLDRIK